MSEEVLINIDEIAPVQPTAETKFLATAGLVDLSALAVVALPLMLNAFNAGEPFIGKIAISPGLKKMLIYCADKKWHALIPAQSDGVQMPTISEEVYENII